MHALPAALIHALGLKGELLLDPFGGTGQTAVEAVKTGCEVVTGDSQAVATLVAKARLTFLNADMRVLLREIDQSDIMAVEAAPAPEFPNRDQWHHPQTLLELTKIRAFVHSFSGSMADSFLETCFSSILTKSTGRRREEFAYFADNTPLGSAQTEPPIQPAIEDFIAQLRQNIDRLERFYSVLERRGRDPEIELSRARVVNADAATCRSGILRNRTRDCRWNHHLPPVSLHD